MTLLRIAKNEYYKTHFKEKEKKKKKKKRMEN